MSIYNETVDEMLMSVESIANQSITDVEVIIINDNPTRKDEIEVALSQLLANDNRFNLYHNESNIGLAMSMNRAADLANSEFLIRMDADDVCEGERFQIILDMLWEVLKAIVVKLLLIQMFTSKIVSKFQDKTQHGFNMLLKTRN